VAWSSAVVAGPLTLVNWLSVGVAAAAAVY
jgi:hypothetical protein